MKRTTAYTGKESALQEATAKWLWLNHPDLLAFHPPNGGKRPTAMVYRGGQMMEVAAAGAALKRQGVVAGVPDWIILHPAGPYAGLLVELKTARGKLSGPQAEFLAKAEAVGYKTDIAWSLEQFISIVTNYLKN
jgi:hypothetical protein